MGVAGRRGRAGVVDDGYRGEQVVALCATSVRGPRRRHAQLHITIVDVQVVLRSMTAPHIQYPIVIKFPEMCCQYSQFGQLSLLCSTAAMTMPSCRRGGAHHRRRRWRGAPLWRHQGPSCRSCRCRCQRWPSPHTGGGKSVAGCMRRGGRGGGGSGDQRRNREPLSLV